MDMSNRYRIGRRRLEGSNRSNLGGTFSHPPRSRRRWASRDTTPPRPHTEGGTGNPLPVEVVGLQVRKVIIVLNA